MTFGLIRFTILRENTLKSHYNSSPYHSDFEWKHAGLSAEPSLILRIKELFR
ncbi:hypothetical protein DSCA_39780 [Desulfosarcina alkanivorans]|uniref:Uncharacterized protein n=1 Tax=Desulfosarcina alkanivorans TaxID=571177 RepID=A0A5K7YML1_9BACT|nr:hypothetical protein DSCA_39780 [Desulfosarcina alkanivorans]